MSGGWNTIESDAGVFTYLLSSLGVENVQFEELVSLDASELSDLNALGVIFLFKYPTDQARATTDSGPQDGQYDFEAMERGVVSDDTDAVDGNAGVWFASQTIQNACGTQALLSVVMNKAGPDTTGPSGDDEIKLGGALREFRDFTRGFPAELRGEALSNSSLIRDAHNSFARSSPFLFDQSRADDAKDENAEDVYHFIAYTSINSVLYELDGLQPAPISHGVCSAVDFPHRIIPVLQRRINRYPAREIRFNLLAMCPDLRRRAMTNGDQAGLVREMEKRRDWMWENSLRRHNFVAFIGELGRMVVTEKVGTGGYDEWVAAATDRTVRSRMERRARKAI